MIVLLEPPTHTENAPALTRPAIPHDLAMLALHARRDQRARRALADALLVRRWDTDDVADVLDMDVATVAALATVQRPGTAAAHVAAALVPSPRVTADVAAI